MINDEYDHNYHIKLDLFIKNKTKLDKITREKTRKMKKTIEKNKKEH